MNVLARYICLLVSFILFLVDNISAQNLHFQRREDIKAGIMYNESVYAISNYSCVTSISPETLTLDELLEKPFEGFYFYIKSSDDSTLMLRKPDGAFLPFDDALSSIRRALASDSDKIMTLFLDSDSDHDFEKAFDKSGLMDYLLEYDSRSSWPSLREMISSGKRLVLFGVRPSSSNPSWLNNMSDFVSHTDVDWSNASTDVESFDERLNKNLSLFTGYKFLSVSRGDVNYISAMARRSPYLIESFKRAWIRDGMVPNFVLLDKYYSWVDGSILNLRNFNIVYGSVKINGEPLNYVNWDGMSNNTSGRYSFPLEPGAEIKLAPSSPGYEIEPTLIYASASHRKNYIDAFEAIPLPIEKELELYLPFEQNGDDMSSSGNTTIARNVEFIQDPMRGGVASLEGASRVALPTASELGVRDHDFTVSVWLKIPRYLPGKNGYCVLGGKNGTYQQALHLMIRDKKPYMGFYNNDLVGNTLIEPGKWYNIVWRYNKSNGEQAIFVDGKLDAISNNRPAYLGSDTLYVGHMDFSRSSDFVGVIDNLTIWSRVLGDKEVLGIYNQLFDFRPSRPITRWGLLLGILILSLLAIIIYLKYRFSSKRKKDMVKAEVVEPVLREKTLSVEAKPLQRNYIRMFGDFYVLDRDGNDITSLFTPKIKQLFMLIMVHSSRGESGISSSELTRLIWGDNGSPKSLKSLRSVSILKLRKILERMDSVEILFTSNRYQLQISEAVYCDYMACLDILDGRVRSRGDFDRFYAIIGNGELFKDESFEWLDDYKSYVCNSSVDVLSRFIGDISAETSTDHVIEIADKILINDPCNEEALGYKIKALVKQDNFRLARYAYDRFSALYQEMYGEPFPTSFEDIIGDISSGDAR